MNTTIPVHHAARIARTLDDVAEDIRPALASCAAESCRLMLDNGWDPAGDTYEIGAMPGDRQVAEEQIGRALTREEARALELCIRAHLAAASDARPHFAALGTDGRRPVAWGIGRTEVEAFKNGAHALRYSGAYADSADLKIVKIDAERYARIEGGEVAASDLWNAS